MENISHVLTIEVVVPGKDAEYTDFDYDKELFMRLEKLLNKIDGELIRIGSRQMTDVKLRTNSNYEIETVYTYNVNILVKGNKEKLRDA